MPSFSDERLVCVVWRDNQGGSAAEYTKVDLPHEPTVMQTYGLLLRWDDSGVSVANEQTEHGSWRGHTFIMDVNLVGVYDCGIPARRRLKRLVRPTEPPPEGVV